MGIFMADVSGFLAAGDIVEDTKTKASPPAAVSITFSISDLCPMVGG